MKKITIIERTIKDPYVTEIICDRCEKVISVYDADDNHWSDIIGVQEYHSIDYVAGYGSVFGDGSRVRADICQECLEEIIGDFVRLDDPDTLEEE